MGMDPGADNFAVVVLDDRQVVHARMVRNPIKTMKREHNEQRATFRKEVRWLLRKFKPDQLLVEQFAVRGFGTQLTEVIGIMIGCVLMACDYCGTDPHTTMASTWKQAARRKFDLDAAYERAKKLRLAPHVVDALCIALFLRNGMTFVKGDGARVNKSIPVLFEHMQRTSPSYLLKPPRVKKQKGKKRR